MFPPTSFATTQTAALTVPSDCAVIGFDDVGVASHRLIGLTSVRQPVVQMAEEAMTLLLARLGSYRTDDAAGLALLLGLLCLALVFLADRFGKERTA